MSKEREALGNIIFVCEYYFAYIQLIYYSVPICIYMSPLIIVHFNNVIFVFLI